MDLNILKIAGLVAGIGGLSLGVFLLIFRDVIRKNVFSKLTKEHSYRILRLILILSFVVALVGIIAWVSVTVWGNSTPVPSNRDDISDEEALSKIAKMGLNVSRKYVEHIFGPSAFEHEIDSNEIEAAYFDRLFCMQVLYSTLSVKQDHDVARYAITSLDQRFKPEVPFIKKRLGTFTFAQATQALRRTGPVYVKGWRGANRCGYEEGVTLTLGGGVFQTIFFAWCPEGAAYNEPDAITPQLISSMAESDVPFKPSQEKLRPIQAWRATVKPNTYAIATYILWENTDVHWVGVLDWVIKEFHH